MTEDKPATCLYAVQYFSTSSGSGISPRNDFSTDAQSCTVNSFMLSCVSLLFRRSHRTRWRSTLPALRNRPSCFKSAIQQTQKGLKVVHSSLQKTNCRATELHLTYGITQWVYIYLPGRMEGWVDLGVSYMSKWFICPQTVTHKSDSNPTGRQNNDLAITSTRS